MCKNQWTRKQDQVKLSEDLNQWKLKLNAKKSRSNGTQLSLVKPNETF